MSDYAFPTSIEVGDWLVQCQRVSHPKFGKRYTPIAASFKGEEPFSLGGCYKTAHEAVRDGARKLREDYPIPGSRQRL